MHPEKLQYLRESIEVINTKSFPEIIKNHFLKLFIASTMITSTGCISDLVIINKEQFETYTNDKDNRISHLTKLVNLVYDFTWIDPSDIHSIGSTPIYKEIYEKSMQDLEQFGIKSEGQKSKVLDEIYSFILNGKSKNYVYANIRAMQHGYLIKNIDIADDTSTDIPMKELIQESFDDFSKYTGIQVIIDKDGQRNLDKKSTIDIDVRNVEQPKSDTPYGHADVSMPIDGYIYEGNIVSNTSLDSDTTLENQSTISIYLKETLYDYPIYVNSTLDEYKSSSVIEFDFPFYTRLGNKSQWMKDLSIILNEDKIKKQIISDFIFQVLHHEICHNLISNSQHSSKNLNDQFIGKYSYSILQKSIFPLVIRTYIDEILSNIQESIPKNQFEIKGGDGGYPDEIVTPTVIRKKLPEIDVPINTALIQEIIKKRNIRQYRTIKNRIQVPMVKLIRDYVQREVEKNK